MSCGSNCDDAMKKVHLFIDHEIESADCAQIEAHLAECGRCGDEFAVERLLKALVSRSCRDAAPEVLRERVLWSIRTININVHLED